MLRLQYLSLLAQIGSSSTCTDVHQATIAWTNCYLVNCISLPQSALFWHFQHNLGA